MIKVAMASIIAFTGSGNFHLSTLDSASGRSPTPQQHILAIGNHDGLPYQGIFTSVTYK